MQISVEQLQAEAGQLALENRLKDRALAEQAARISLLEQKVAELEGKDESGDRSED